MIRSKLLILSFASAMMMTGLGAFGQQNSTEWQKSLAHILPLMGHRNWIMIVDSAYPLAERPRSRNARN